MEIPEFAECRFGEFEYKNYAELNGNSDYQRYIDSGGTTAFPGGETKSEFTDRVMRGFEKVFVDVESRQVKPGEGIAGWLEATADGMQIVSYEKMKLPHGMKNGA